MLDIATTICGPSVVWAFPDLALARTSWEARWRSTRRRRVATRGRTIAQCVTGRLATLEEIVDRQPYDHAGWRLVVAGLDRVDASADLEPTESGT